jgi:hypothetical protein
MTAPTKLSLYNGALRILGQSRLSALTETGEARRLLDDAWADDVVRDCLAAGQWTFACRTVMLDPSPSESTEFGFTNVYTKPDDWVRTVALCSDEFLQNQIGAIHIDGANWYTEDNPVYLRYVSDGDTYGRDYSLWTGGFTRFVQASLAEEIAMALTHDDKLLAVAQKAAKEAKLVAENEDAMNQPTRRISAGVWANARRSSGWTRERCGGRSTSTR